MKKLFTFIFLILIVSVSKAERFQYSVSYIGIPVTKVEITLTSNNGLHTINAKATSNGVASAFFQVNNIYTSYCDSNFIPFFYKKSIDQQNLKDNKVLKFHREVDSITVKDNIKLEKLSKFAAKMPIYDLISFAFTASKTDTLTKSFSVVSDFDIWEFTQSYLREDYIHTAGKNFICNKYQIRMDKVYDNPTEQSTDLLTNNLFDEETKLLVWYSADRTHIPVKMKFKKFIFSVVLKLQKFM